LRLSYVVLFETSLVKSRGVVYDVVV